MNNFTNLKISVFSAVCSLITLITVAVFTISYTGTGREVPGDVYNAPVIKVYVTGEVKNPGVYEFTPGQRVVDAIDAAGGITDSGNKDALDLADFLSDGETIRVPAVENAAVVSDIKMPDTSGATLIKININTASADELCRLDGIGEGLAGRIVEYRVKHGDFEAPEDIMEVSGISEKRFEAICDDITI